MVALEVTFNNRILIHVSSTSPILHIGQQSDTPVSILNTPLYQKQVYNKEEPLLCCSCEEEGIFLPFNITEVSFIRNNKNLQFWDSTEISLFSTDEGKKTGMRSLNFTTGNKQARENVSK